MVKNFLKRTLCIALSFAMMTGTVMVGAKTKTESIHLHHYILDTTSFPDLPAIYLTGYQNQTVCKHSLHLTALPLQMLLPVLLLLFPDHKKRKEKI